MAAPSPVLYALHHTIEPRGFEHLCVDLLVREGHSRIIPGGKSRDHGRDAEVRYWVGTQKGAPQTAFQFSMELKWEAKLRQDIAKILRNCDSINRIVFVSNRSITVEKQDKLRKEFWESDQVALEIFDEGWFRVRLEEDHIDLALKHLGVVVEPTAGFHATQIKVHGLSDKNQEEILRYTSAESLRATLTAQTRADATDMSAWKGLAHICYHLRDYEAGLLAVSRALEFCNDDVERWNLVGLKASIIAEQGIQSGSRLQLKKAKALFQQFLERLDRSIDHYNYANILGALDNEKEAEFHYRRSLELDPHFAPTWKNLGSLLVKASKLKEGMKCLDRALQINPDLLEALCTKANVIVMSHGDCREAISLMDRAFEIDADLECRWPHAHYWYAMALCQDNRLSDALPIVEDRLERKVDCPFLSRLASDILSKLWRSDPSYLSKAEEHFDLRVDATEPDYRALVEMLDILYQTNRESHAWELLDRLLEAKEISVQKIAERVPLTLPQLAEAFSSMDYYQGFRESSPLGYYAQILYDLKLEPHPEVPNILLHLLAPSYFKIASLFQNGGARLDEECEIETLQNTYTLISDTFAAFGGFLLSPVKPNKAELSSLIAGGVVAGHDIPLMEISRLIGYLSGFSGRPQSKQHEAVIIEATSSIHESWIDKFFKSIDEDWEIDSLSEPDATND
jgi:tetratricopeptide (TPR) repeat protein